MTIKPRSHSRRRAFETGIVAGLLIGLAIALVAAFLVAVGRPAHTAELAHGDAAWIMTEPRYVDADNVHCCGPTDCAPMPDGAVEETERGFVIKATGETIHWTAKGVYVSRDDRFWSCFRSGKTRCLFVPGRMG